VRKGWWRLAQFAFALLVIGLAARSLVRDWSAFRSQAIEWQIRPVLLVSSVLIVWLSYAFLIEAWRRVVVSMGQHLRYGDAARICMLANLGKYLPGKVWSIAGAAILAQEAGVAPPAAVAGAVTLQALALASGVTLVGLMAPAAFGSLSPSVRALTLVLGVVAVIGVAALSSRRALGAVQQAWPRATLRLEPIAPRALLAAYGVNLFAWCAYGLAFLCLVKGLTPSAPISWPEATGVFTLSYLAGLIALFAPAGLGPREGVFVLLLTGPLGPRLAVALAVATRVLLTITELGAAVPFLGRFRSELRARG